MQVEVVGADFRQNLFCLCRRVQVEARDIAGVDHFDQAFDARALHFSGGKTQIVQVGAAQRTRLGPVGRDTGHAVQPLAAESFRIVDGLRDTVAKLLNARRMARQAALPGVPVPCRGVEQDLGKAVLIEPRFDVFDRKIIWKKILHALETGLCGGLRNGRGTRLR